MLGLKKGTARVVSYRPVWSHLFEQERHLPQRHIGHLALDIEHVGSTAVPGLDAKPILDIAVAVVSVIPRLARPLCRAGYVDRGDKGRDGGRLFVKESAPEVRTHHVHVLAMDDQQWREYLLFRDTLRGGEGISARYAAFKRALRERYPDDRSAYTAAKRAFVRDVLSRRNRT